MISPISILFLTQLATSIGFNFMLLLNRHPSALVAVGSHLVAEPVGISTQAQVIGS